MMSRQQEVGETVRGASRMRVSHAINLVENMTSMFNNSRYSDAKVIIHGVVLPVHKIIICRQSLYFEKAFQKDAFIEGQAGCLTFNDGSAAAYWKFFEYLYTGDYTHNLPIRIQDDPILLQDLRVYALADMFFVDRLKELCADKLRAKLREFWQCESFPECVRQIYAFTSHNDRNMRPAVVEAAKMNARSLLTKEAFKELIGEVGDFAVDMIAGVVSEAPAGNVAPMVRPVEYMFSNQISAYGIY